jgi:site-specific DNA-methyltransferase (adenine-specific)
MNLMKQYPDKHFDLAIVDPPYGIGQDWKKRNKGKNFIETSYKNKTIPDKGYFSELFRVSKNQIIWGYNYFVDILGPTNYLIVWDKACGENQIIKYSQGEIAYASFHVPIRIVSIPWDGYRMGAETGITKIHPHQKPVALYKWLLSKYAKPGWKNLDTHLGSGSLAIACYDMGFPRTACEIDEDYFTAACERLRLFAAQGTLDFGGVS